jgi:hypothetical protein
MKKISIKMLFLSVPTRLLHREQQQQRRRGRGGGVDGVFVGRRHGPRKGVGLVGRQLPTRLRLQFSGNFPQFLHFQFSLKFIILFLLTIILNCEKIPPKNLIK